MSGRVSLKIILALAVLLISACERGLDTQWVDIPGDTTSVSEQQPADSLDGDYWSARYAAMRSQYVNELFRSYGVGFGYNALGEYASYNDVRDRVIDLNELRKVRPSLIYDINTPKAFQHVIEGLNSEKYLNQLSLLAGINANVGFFQGQAKLNFNESDMRLEYLSYCSIYDGITMAQRHLEPYDLIELSRTNPEILSAGFRRYLDRAAYYNGMDRVDSAVIILNEMFRTYGTHMIYHAELGGTLEFQCTVDRRALDSRVTLKTSAEHELFLIGGSKQETVNDSALSVTREERKSKLIIKGGDASLATKVLYTDTDSPEDRNRLVTEWYQSVRFDTGNPMASNVELIGVKLIPIAEFIVDPGLQALYSQIMGKAVELENESFPRSYPTRNVRLNTDVLDFSMTSTIVSDGETIGEIDYEVINGREYSVFYPLIDGSVHHEGIARCLQTDSICTVTWTYTVDPLNTMVYVTPIAPESNIPFIYCSSGKADVTPDAGIEYRTAYSRRPLDLVMWNDRCNMGIKFGPYSLLRGCYANVNDKGYANYITMSKDVPFGYELVSTSEMPAILETVRKITGTDSMPEFLKQLWIMPPSSEGSVPLVYDFREIGTNGGSMPDASDLGIGFILCRRSRGFRYP